MQNTLQRRIIPQKLIIINTAAYDGTSLLLIIIKIINTALEGRLEGFDGLNNLR